MTWGKTRRMYILRSSQFIFLPEEKERASFCALARVEFKTTCLSHILSPAVFCWCFNCWDETQLSQGGLGWGPAPQQAAPGAAFTAGGITQQFHLNSWSSHQRKFFNSLIGSFSMDKQLFCLFSLPFRAQHSEILSIVIFPSALGREGCSSVKFIKGSLGQSK